MIRLKNISRLYRTASVETAALDAVDLQITEREFVAITGPSGCGKSTLLNILGMIDKPTSGEYWFAERDIAALSESGLVDIRKRNLGFIFQNFNLIDQLSVYENVELPLLYQGINRGRRKERVREVLELVGLGARMNHRPAQLSGGQQQRVAVARAVVADPKLILADEPTGNLDSGSGDEVMGMLDTLNQLGATIVIVTHSLEYASRAQRSINMLDGKVVSPTVTPLAGPHAESRQPCLSTI